MITGWRVAIQISAREATWTTDMITGWRVAIQISAREATWPIVKGTLCRYLYMYYGCAALHSSLGHIEDTRNYDTAMWHSSLNVPDSLVILAWQDLVCSVWHLHEEYVLCYCGDRILQDECCFLLAAGWLYCETGQAWFY